MAKGRTRSIFGFVILAAFVLSLVPVSADNKDKNDKNNAAVQPTSSNSKLSKKENPEFVGKRDINNNQINFYSIEKEIGIGHQLAAEVERQLKFVEDPVISEY